MTAAAAHMTAAAVRVSADAGGAGLLRAGAAHVQVRAAGAVQARLLRAAPDVLRAPEPDAGLCGARGQMRACGAVCLDTARIAVLLDD